MTDYSSETISVRLNHENSSLDKLEEVKKKDKSIEEAVDECEHIEEYFLLKTCNRLELYLVSSRPDKARENFERNDIFQEFQVKNHLNTQRHLLELAAGLKSAIVGEDEILGQIKDQKEASENLRNDILEKTIEKAIQTGKKVRNQTGINEGKRSVPALAVEKSKEKIDSQTVTVVGAGETAEKVVEHLEKPEEVYIVNRTLKKAEEIADKRSNCCARPLENLSEVLENTDVLFTAVSTNQPIIKEEEQAESLQLIVDLGSPRNVKSNLADHILDLADLKKEFNQIKRQREQAIENSKIIVSRELERLKNELRHKQAEHALSKMHQKSHKMKKAQLEYLFRKMTGLDREQKEMIEDMADSLVNNMLAAPTRSLKKAAEDEDWETIQKTLQIFNQGCDENLMEEKEVINIV